MPLSVGALSVGAPSLQIIILCLMFIVIATLLHFNAGQELIRTSSPNLWIGLAFYVLGNVVWRYGREGEPACNPDSLFQYHALWHLFAGFGTYTLNLYWVFQRWGYLQRKPEVCGPWAARYIVGSEAGMQLPSVRDRRD